MRNEYCAVCSVAEKRKKQIPKHIICYRNWNGSSAAMESDIIVEGFRLSEQTHRLRCMHVIRDRDSLVMANLHQCVPYDPFITKIKYSNDACKCSRSWLESLAKDHSEFRGRGGVTK